MIEKRIGCTISRFSSLDQLVIIIVMGGISIYILGFPISIWTFLMIYSLWFSIRFIFYRTLYFKFVLSSLLNFGNSSPAYSDNFPVVSSRGCSITSYLQSNGSNIITLPAYPPISFFF